MMRRIGSDCRRSMVSVSNSSVVGSAQCTSSNSISTGPRRVSASSCSISAVRILRRLDLRVSLGRVLGGGRFGQSQKLGEQLDLHGAACRVRSQQPFKLRAFVRGTVVVGKACGVRKLSLETGCSALP